MLLPGLDPWYQRIMPQVVDFRVDHFWLGGELRQLYAVREVGATEAVIFYSARILEVLATTALDSVRLEASVNVCSNLVTLEQYDLIPKEVRYWAHALRRLGNGVRHIHSAITPDDAELALLFAGRWLQWFFCDFQFGPRLVHLTCDGSPLRLHTSEPLSDLLASIDGLHQPQGRTSEQPNSKLAQLQSRLGPQLLQTAVVPALIADVWLDRAVDRAETGGVRDMLRRALARHPQDVRLQQLLVLALSRDEHWDEALACLEPQLSRDKNDEETVGIGAGVYKRLWQADRTAVHRLKKSHQLYQQGWKQSKKASPYLGINAAATALWLGRPAEARRLAGEVRRLLMDRADRLRNIAKLDLRPDYWTQVTLAESLLIIGEFGGAATVYRAAFASHENVAGSVGSARKQIRETLAAMGLPLDDAGLLAKKEFRDPAVRVGVTGHRRIDVNDRLAAQVRRALAQIRDWACERQTDAQFVVVSALAEGADRLVPELACAPEFAAQLEVVLPLELADYAEDFSRADSLAQFYRLLAAADAVHFPTPVEDNATPNRPSTASGPLTGIERNAGYEAAGRSIVDRCQALIAIWDGQPAAGHPGTGDVVAYARKLGRPLVWIRSHAPHEIVTERL